MQKLQVGIIGSGKIACDLLAKVLNSNKLDCRMFSGRNNLSEGILYAKHLGVQTSNKGIDAIINNIDSYDVIFDATSALAHLEHRKQLETSGKTIINLTPTNTGISCVPAVNLSTISPGQEINMITCGGQASIPIIYSIKERAQKINYVEVVSSISSKSAGAATRLNICEYLENTEKAISEFSNCKNKKAILNINPADPSVDMQTTIYMLVEKYSHQSIIDNLFAMVKKVQAYAPYYQLVCQPIFDENKITIIVKVRGLGDYLPPYAGNLDIITSTSIRVAEYLFPFIYS